MRRPFVRRYEEERELTVMLVVDLSGSERFGTARRFKGELAVELAAVLALAAVRNNDRVGLVLFTTASSTWCGRARGGGTRSGSSATCSPPEPVGTGTRVGAAAEYVGKLLGHKAIVFVVSDFADPDLEHPLKRLALRHDVVAVTVEDPGERALPDVGLARFVDPETGQVVDVDTGDARVRAAYDAAVAEERRRASGCSGGSPSTRCRCAPTAATWSRSCASSARARPARPSGDGPAGARPDRGPSAGCRRRARRPRRAADPCRAAGAFAGSARRAADRRVGADPAAHATHTPAAPRGVTALLAPALAAALVLAPPARGARAQAPAAPAPAAAATVPRVRAGVTLTPDTVTVGDPFVVQVRVAAPAGATVEFPAGPDSAGAVDLLDPRRETIARAADGGVDVTATYRAAAWDVGALPLGLGDVVVRAAGAERRIPLGALRVAVRSVLPADSARRVPKPVREPVPDPGLWWLRLALIAALAAVAVALLAWLARRWWLARRRVVPADAAYRTAVAAFERLERLRLVEAGEGGRHVALATDIARDYLAAAPPRRRPLAHVGRAGGGARRRPRRAARAAHGAAREADLVKFAGVEIGAGRAAAGGRDARLVVDETEEAARAREAAAAAEAAARERADREARRRYEEERRRAARRDAASDAPPGRGGRAA
jgi:hypothetical protein